MRFRRFVGTAVCAIFILAASSASVLGQNDSMANHSPAANRDDSPSFLSDAAAGQSHDFGWLSSSPSRWTASAEFIFLDRIGSVPYSLVETVSGTVSLNDLPSAPGTEMLNANGLPQGFAGGPRLGLIHHGDSGYDLELSYFQIDGWNDYRSFGPTPDWLVMRASSNFLQTQDWKDTQMMAWDYASRLYNAELNVRWNPLARLTLLAGFRWTNLSEELQGTLPELPGTLPQRREPFWDASVRNNLYGFQVGAMESCSSAAASRSTASSRPASLATMWWRRPGSASTGTSTGNPLRPITPLFSMKSVCSASIKSPRSSC